MKHLLIIFILLLTSVSWSEDFDLMEFIETGYERLWSKDVDWNDLFERNGLLYQKYTDKPFTGKSTGTKQGRIIKGLRQGKWKFYHNSGELHYKGNYKDGKQNGEFLQYFYDGKLQLKKNYKKGKLHGEHEEYYYNGNLFYKGRWKNNKQVGQWFYYYENGELIETKQY